MQKNTAQKKQKCKNCEGKGTLKKGDRVVRCQRCGGSGIKRWPAPTNRRNRALNDAARPPVSVAYATFRMRAPTHPKSVHPFPHTPLRSPA